MYLSTALSHMLQTVKIYQDNDYCGNGGNEYRGTTRPDERVLFIPGYATEPVNMTPRWRGEHSKNIYLFIKNFFSQQHSTNLIITKTHY